MTRPTGLPKGRPAGAEGMLAEARVQAFSVRHELERHDQWEIASLEVAELLIERGDAPGALRLVRELRRRDIRENALHGEITDVFETRRQAGGRAG